MPILEATGITKTIDTGTHRVEILRGLRAADLAARFAYERGELVRTAGFDTILLAAGLDDCVRHW